MPAVQRSTKELCEKNPVCRALGHSFDGALSAMQKFRPMRAVVQSRFVDLQVRNENINSVSKADNDGVPCGTRSRWSGLLLGSAENGLGTKTVRIFPGVDRSGAKRRFAMFRNFSEHDYNAGFSALLAVA